MIWVIAYIFTLLAVINWHDPVKFKVALSFAVIHILNPLVDFQGIAFYYSAIGACIILLLYPLMVSQRNWVLAFAITLTSCMSVNLLGIINYERWHSDVIGNFIDYANYLTTAIEMVILLCMANGKLDGYYTDSLERMGQHPFWHIFTRINPKLYLSKVVQK